jgi:adenosylcobyric acid synthase
VQLADGWVDSNRRVWGTYLHGLFDSDQFRRAFLHEIRRARGVASAGGPEFSWQAFQEEQLDRLAEVVRRHLDLAKIRALVGLG